MIIIRNLKLPLDFDFANLTSSVNAHLKLKNWPLEKVKLYKKSVDCRDESNIFFNCSVTANCKNETEFIKRNKRLDVKPFVEEKYIFPENKNRNNIKSPIIVGFGPAGIFAAYILSLAGLKPIVIEQGEDVDSRTKTVKEFFETNKLNPFSNVQFGEGGAGTFSDGKLNTGIKDIRCRTVLEIFHKFGAKEEILYDSKPHIGTDALVGIIKNIRNEIISLGGKVLFSHKLVGIEIENEQVKSIKVNANGKSLSFLCDNLILAIGHSSRDTYKLLKSLNVPMSPKPFAMGVRIEHKQNDINKAQYKSFANHKALKSADYKLAVHLNDGRGVFTFCMCPGGYVVNASSEQGGVVTNGMSYSKRDGENANSALLVSVGVEDYFKGDILDGIKLQREIEQKAYTVGNGYPICQTVGDFLDGKASNSPLGVTPTVSNVTYGNIRDVLPPFITNSIKEALPLLDKKLKGFSNENAIFTCPETRSSSPVRIERNFYGESKILGIYPCGEGAGYAGGIMSAAVDGMKIAEKVIEKFSVDC